ncbi:MAG: hypothetical protein ACMXX5_02070 [Candidatus Woesearchaeota archaeon]
MKQKNLFQQNVENVIQDLGINVAKYWLEMFKALPPYQIGVIKASGKLMEDHCINQLCAEMSYMTNKGIYLPIVLGGGIQYNSIPGYSEAKKPNGLRVTSLELMIEISELAQHHQQKVAKILEANGTSTEIISPSSIIAKAHGIEIDETGKPIDTLYVGDIVSIDTKPIIQAILNGRIPIISHIGTNHHEMYNINATTLAAEIVKYLEAKKLILLGDTPVIDDNGEIIKIINSEDQANQLVKQGIISGGMVTNVNNAYNLLAHLGPGHSVQITKLKQANHGSIDSTGLLEEILGDGSGTKLVLPHKISSYPLCAISESEISVLINSIFSEKGEQLVEGYFEMLKQKNPTIYLDSLRQGGAITYPLEDCEYLCKIFTHKNYEGLGIAKSIIDIVIKQKGALAWRTNALKACNIEKYNRILMSYSNNYNISTIKENNYVVFMIGVPEHAKQNVAKQVLEIPKTLKPIS